MRGFALCLAALAMSIARSRDAGFLRQDSRLRVINGCQSEPIWIGYEVGAPYGACGTLPDDDFLKLEVGAFHDYMIPQTGICGFRLWPMARCGADGKALGLSGDVMDCEIGPSGGIHSNNYCPGDIVNTTSGQRGLGCSPPIDSKFEASFGCEVAERSKCQSTPQGGTLFNASDYWDTSLVDGWTLPFKVRVLDECEGGPPGGSIDCSALSLSNCPESENLSNAGMDFPSLRNVSLSLAHPITGRKVGCKSPCSYLAKPQWAFNSTSYPETSDQAKWFCCPTPPIDPADCRGLGNSFPGNYGPVKHTSYVSTVHKYCPHVYAYSYDEIAAAGALWKCPPGVRYEVTFMCP